MMKFFLSGWLMAVLLITTVQSPLRAQAPIIQTKFTADPAPMVYKDTVFLYTTHDEDDAPEGMAGFRMKEWLLYTSTDMVNWTDHGVIADLHNFAWAAPEVSGWGGFENGAWAPQCVERNGKFYLYCPIQGRGIGVLMADTPYGPFTDPIGKPLVGPEYDSIDPSIFIDDKDGQAYLYWGNPNLWYVKLNKDMISCSGEITKDKQFAKKEGQPNPYHYQEGPWMYKRNGHYYMAYASTCCPEGIGYAMGSSPVGPWDFKGYIMKPDGRSSGNHPGIIDYKGKSYIFGFNYRLNFMITDKHHERRSICAAELGYNQDGTIKELAWWDDGTGISPAEELNPYRRVEAETMAWSQGVKTAKDDKTGMYATSIHNGDYIQVKSVDFKKGAESFEVSAATITKGRIEIRLNDMNGKLLGVCLIKNTGGWNHWKTFVADTEKREGVHDLYLVFKGGDGEVFNLDYWRFR